MNCQGKKYSFQYKNCPIRHSLERERERERGRERDRQTERQRDRERQTDRETDRDREKLNALARLTPYMELRKTPMLMNVFFNSQFNYCSVIWVS